MMYFHFLAILWIFVTRANSSPAFVTPVSKLQSSWTFKGYAGTACNAAAPVQAGSTGSSGCSSTGATTVINFTYNGGGQFKLCLWSTADCSGDVVTSVNGGFVTCIGAGADVHGYSVVNRGSDC